MANNHIQYSKDKDSKDFKDIKDKSNISDAFGAKKLN
jgi:hypothetical protein